MAFIQSLFQSFSGSLTKGMPSTDSTSVYIDANHTQYVADGFSKAYQECLLCDTVVHTGMGKLYVHRLVIEAFRPSIGKLLQCENDGNDINMADDVTPSAVTDLINWLYTGTIPIGTEYILLLNKGVDTKKKQKSIKDSINDIWLWANNQHCDVTLCVDGQEIAGHKVMLALFSPYFSAMFSHDMQEGKSNRINILEPNLPKSVLRALVHYMYSGEITITGDNVQALLVGSNFLGVNATQEACVTFVKSNMDASSCASVFHMADTLGNMNLRQTAKSYFLHNFTRISKEDDYLDLPVELLVELFSDDYIYVELNGVIPPTKKLELVLFEALLRYIQHDVRNRSTVVSKLLSTIRLPLMDKKDLKRVAKDLKKLGLDNECQNVLMQATADAQAIATGSPSRAESTAWTTPRFVSCE